MAAAEQRAQLVHLDDMPHDKREDDHPGGPLERVADIAAVGIGGRIRHSAGDDDEADGRVKQDRDEDERPFDEGQKHSQRMNLLDGS